MDWWKLTQKVCKLEYDYFPPGPMNRSARENGSWDHCILQAGTTVVCYDATWDEAQAWINRGRVPYRKE